MLAPHFCLNDTFAAQLSASTYATGGAGGLVPVGPGNGGPGGDAIASTTLLESAYTVIARRMAGPAAEDFSLSLGAIKPAATQRRALPLRPLEPMKRMPLPWQLVVPVVVKTDFVMCSGGTAQAFASGSSGSGSVYVSANVFGGPGGVGEPMFGLAARAPIRRSSMQ